MIGIERIKYVGNATEIYCLAFKIVGTAYVQLVLPKLLTNIGTLKGVIENKFRGRGRRGQVIGHSYIFLLNTNIINLKISCLKC